MATPAEHITVSIWTGRGTPDWSGDVENDANSEDDLGSSGDQGHDEASDTATPTDMETRALAIDFTKFHISMEAYGILDGWLQDENSPAIRFEMARLWCQFVKCFGACAYANEQLARLSEVDANDVQNEYVNARESLEILKEFAYAMHLANNMVARGNTYVILKNFINTEVSDAPKKCLLESLDVMQDLRSFTIEYCSLEIDTLIDAISYLVHPTDDFGCGPGGLDGEELEDYNLALGDWDQNQRYVREAKQLIFGGFSHHEISLWQVPRYARRRHNGITKDVGARISSKPYSDFCST